MNYTKTLIAEPQSFQVWVPTKSKISNALKRRLGRPNKFGTTSVCKFSTVMCQNSAQRCAEFGTSAWEGVRHSGWKFSILGITHSMAFSITESSMAAVWMQCPHLCQSTKGISSISTPSFHPDLISNMFFFMPKFLHSHTLLTCFHQNKYPLNVNMLNASQCTMRCLFLSDITRVTRFIFWKQDLSSQMLRTCCFRDITQRQRTVG